MSTIEEILSLHFCVIEEKKREYLLSKPEYKCLNLLDSENPLRKPFLYELTTKGMFENYEDPEVEKYLDIIYSDTELIKEFAELLNKSNPLKKSFKYYVYNSHIFEEELWGNNNYKQLTSQRAWSLLISQIYSQYMYHAFQIRYTKML